MIKINKAKVKQIIKDAGLIRIWDDLEKDLKKAIAIDYEVGADFKVKIGLSKFGGKPDLPIGTEWPTFRNLPQSFVAQINFKEIKKFDKYNIFPESGLLSLFFDSTQLDEYGLGYKVLFTEETNNLVRSKPPEVGDVEGKEDIENIIFKTGIPKFSNFYSVPFYGHEFLNELKEKYDITDLEIEDYLSEIDFNIYNHIMGYPFPMQDNNLEGLCEMEWIDYEYSEEKFKKASSQWREWILLLHIDSNLDLNMCWGDGGILYFWIRKGDLKNKRFDKTILQFQYR